MKNDPRMNCRKRYGVVTILMMLCILLGFTSGCSAESDKRESAETTQVDAVALQLQQADSYFDLGNYDEALEIYQTIDTEYAQSRVRAIECIPIAQQITQEWMSQFEQGIYLDYLALWGLDFEFDTEFDVKNYTFYTKIYYPSLYSSVAAMAGASKEEIGERIESAGYEKTTYLMFYDQGYEDITCICNVYDSDGNILTKFVYNQATYRADLEQEAADRVAEQRQEEERTRIEREFIANMNNDTDFRNCVLERISNTGSYAFEEVVEDYYFDNTGNRVDFILVDLQYGQFWAVDLDKMDKEIEYYEVWNDEFVDHIVVHLSCTASVRIYYEENQFFNVEYDIAIEVDPEKIELTTRLTNYAIKVLSIESNESYWDTINPDKPGPWPDVDAFSLNCSWGAIGDTLQSNYLTANLNNVYVVQTYDRYSASFGYQFAVVDLILMRNTSEPTLILEENFLMMWNKGSEQIVPKFDNEIYTINDNDYYEMVLIYEVPTDIQNYVLYYSDTLDNGTYFEEKSILFNIPNTAQ